MGTGGYAIFHPAKGCLHARAEWYGEATPSNNKAEMRALVEALTWVRGHLEAAEGVGEGVVYGDSALVISFCNRQSRPQV